MIDEYQQQKTQFFNWSQLYFYVYFEMEPKKIGVKAGLVFEIKI